MTDIQSSEYVKILKNCCKRRQRVKDTTFVQQECQRLIRLSRLRIRFRPLMYLAIAAAVCLTLYPMLPTVRDLVIEESAGYIVQGIGYGIHEISQYVSARQGTQDTGEELDEIPQYVSVRQEGAQDTGEELDEISQYVSARQERAQDIGKGFDGISQYVIAGQEAQDTGTGNGMNVISQYASARQGAQYTGNGIDQISQYVYTRKRAQDNGNVSPEEGEAQTFRQEAASVPVPSHERSQPAIRRTSTNHKIPRGKRASLVENKCVHSPMTDFPMTSRSQVVKIHNESKRCPVFTGPQNGRQYAVVQSFKHAWKGYKERAWGHDNLKPVSGMAYDWVSLGLTIVDGIDTAYIMGLTDEYEEGREWIKRELNFQNRKYVNLFEVTIRVLGALMTNYHFSADPMFLDKAKDLGERLMVAFSSPSGIPYSDVSLGSRTARKKPLSISAEVTTLQLEFRDLSRSTGDPKFEAAAAAVSEKLHSLPKMLGLVPIGINVDTGHFTDSLITLGGRADSYYEYLLKQWLQTGKTVKYLLEDYLTAIDGVRELLAKRSSPNKLLYIERICNAEAQRYQQCTPASMDHLTCFLPGTLALGHANGLPDWHLTMAEELLYTCYLTYAAHPTFLAPEITQFNLKDAKTDMFTKDSEAHSLLRPEFVESLWYMYQITGNATYQDWGWQVFQAFEMYAKTPFGYSSIANVKVENPKHKDMMETFFLSETLKYLYLLFSDDRYHIDLSKYVFNTEAHPLPLPHY